MLAAKCTVVLDAYDIRCLITAHMKNAYGIMIDNQDVTFHGEDGEELDFENAIISTELSPKPNLQFKQV